MRHSPTTNNSGDRGPLTLLLLIFALSIKGSVFPPALRADEKPVTDKSLRRAERLIRADLVEEAISELDRVIEDYPQLTEAFYLRGVAHAENKNPESALSDLTLAIERDPKNIRYHHERGRLHFEQGRYPSAIHDLEASLRLEPSLLYARRLLARAQEKVGARPIDRIARKETARLLIAQGNFQEALGVCTQAIEQDPRDAELFGFRSLVHNTLGDGDRAVKDIQREVMLAPERGGNDKENLPSQPKDELSSEDLVYGDGQVQQLFLDRPVLARYLKPKDDLYRWLVQQFAGAGGAGRIRWESKENLRFRAEHVIPTEREQAAIRVSRFYNDGQAERKERPFDDVFCAVVFECENIRNAALFRKTHQAAFEGKLTREAYVKENFRWEHLAALRMRAFYAVHYYPSLKKLSLIPSHTRSNWYLEIPMNYELALSKYPRDEEYPWKFYGGYFDNSVVPYLKAMGKTPPE